MGDRETTQTIICASYERVSTRAQGQHGFSLGAQHLSLEEYARAQGWLLPEHLRFRDGEDIDASGTRWDLPDLTRMLDAAAHREFQVLVVPDLDRFARSLAKGLVLEEQLKKHGVRVVYQRVPVEDTAEGRLLKHQLFSFAEYEREKFAFRTTMGKQQKARVGQVVGIGSHPPYGYRFTYALRNNVQRASGLEPDPITGPIARRILRALPLRSTVDIADELNREGITGQRGTPWTSKAIHRLAIDPVYAGVWVYGKNGRRVSPDDAIGIGVAVPALVGREEWDAVQRALDHRRTARRGRVPLELDPYLLRSMLACGHCHGALHVQTNGTRYYRCLRHIPSAAHRIGKPVCDLPDVHAVALEAELWRILNATLLNRDYLAAGLEAARTQHECADQVRRDRLGILDTEIVKQRQRLDTIAARFADAGAGEVFNALMRQAKDIEDVIGRLTRERAGLAAVRADGLSPAEADAIEGFAADVRAGLDRATDADRRRLYELLHVRGKVYTDAAGVLLGRKHRFRIDWQAAIPLGDSAACLLKRDDL